MSVACGMGDGLRVRMMLVDKFQDKSTIYRTAVFERGVNCRQQTA